jgi:hypothetical protein
MAKAIIPQYAFNNGVVSPRLYARGDFDKYSKSLKTGDNCYITPHGPVIRRSGSVFVEEVKDSTKNTRLIPFIFDNSGDSLVLEFGNNYIRFYKNGARLGAPYEVTTTYTSSEVDDIDYVQYGNILYLSHKDHAPAQLVRTSDTDWTLSDITLSPEPTKELGREPATTLTPGATSGSSVTFTAGSSVFNSADIGRQLVHGAGPGIAIITNTTSSTVCTANIIENFPSTSAISSGDWKLDLSPITKLEFTGGTAGEIIEVVSRQINAPDFTNGDFLNGAESWANISNGTGTAGWDSTSRSLKLTGGGVGNEGIAEQPVDGIWHGLYEVQLDCDSNVTMKVGTTSGGTEISTGLIFGKGVGIIRTIEVFGSIAGSDIFYFSFESTGTVNIDNIRINSRYGAFDSGDIGSYIVANGGVLKIEALSTNDRIDCIVEKSLNTTDDTYSWTLEQPDWTSSRGYPSKVSLFQERLCFANTSDSPTGLWMSETGIFNGFGTGPDDEDSVQVTLSAPDISWIVPNRDLIIGTTNSEVSILGATSGSAISSSNIRQLPKTSYGSDSQVPVQIGSEVVFIQGGGKKLRSMEYDFASDGYQGEDLIFLAEHLPTDIQAIAYAYSPDSILYAIDSTGDMYVGAYVKEQAVIGWSKYTTDGSFESIAAIPSSGNDEVYVVVNRTINGATKRYVERFTFQEGTALLDGFSDSYLTYDEGKTITGITQADPGVVTATSHGFSDGDKVKIVDAGGMTEVNLNTYVVANKTANTFELNDEYGNNIDTSGFTAYTSGGEVHKLVTTISGLTHLEGKEVQVKVDGATHPNKTVSSGSITLDSSAYNVVVGLPYTTTIETLNTQWSTGEGIMQAQAQRKVKVYARIYQSTIPTLNSTNFVPARNVENFMDQRVPLFSGDLEYGSVVWDLTGSLTFTISDPLPFQLQGLFAVTEGHIK